MDSFSFCLPTRFEFGGGTEDQVGRLVSRAGGTKVLILYGGGSVKRSGLLRRVRRSLDRALLDRVEMGGIRPNPMSDLVYEGIDLARDERVDFVLALGGGSMIDTAKAIAAGVLYEGDFWDFYSGDLTPDRALPIGCIPTIAASGSEGSPDSVITQKGTNLKRETSSDVLLPAFAILDPVLTETLPAYQTACGITDMFSHLLERYLTNTQDVSVTDRLIEGLMLAIIEEGPRALTDPTDYQVRANLQWAACMAHNEVVGVGRTHDWASHDIEYALSSAYGVAHGAGLAIVMPAVMEHELDHDVARFAQLARRVWGVGAADDRAAALEGIARQRAFTSGLGMPATLEDIGGTETDIPRLVRETCYAGGRSGTVGGFMPMGERDVAAVFRRMLTSHQAAGTGSSGGSAAQAA